MLKNNRKRKFEVDYLDVQHEMVLPFLQKNKLLKLDNNGKLTSDTTNSTLMDNLISIPNSRLLYKNGSGVYEGKVLDSTVTNNSVCQRTSDGSINAFGLNLSSNLTINGAGNANKFSVYNDWIPNPAAMFNINSSLNYTSIIGSLVISREVGNPVIEEVVKLQEFVEIKGINNTAKLSVARSDGSGCLVVDTTNNNVKLNTLNCLTGHMTIENTNATSDIKLKTTRNIDIDLGSSIIVQGANSTGKLTMKNNNGDLVFAVDTTNSKVYYNQAESATTGNINFVSNFILNGTASATKCQIQKADNTPIFTIDSLTATPNIALAGNITTTHNLYDIATSSNRFKKLYLSSNLDISGTNNGAAINAMILQNYGTHDVNFKMYANNALQSTITANTSGNFGVSSTSSTYTLTDNLIINGANHASKFIVEKSDGTDIFVVDTSTPKIINHTNIIPSATNTHDLGSSSITFSRAYLSNQLDVTSSSLGANLTGISIKNTANNTSSIQLTANNTVTSNIIQQTGGGLKISGASNNMLTINNTNAASSGITLSADNGANTGVISLNTSNIFSVNRQLNPAADNSYSLGGGSNRWTAVYAVNGTIQTSDKNYKKEIDDSDLGIDFINQLKPRKYKFIDNHSDRIHYGLVSQEILEILEKNNFCRF